MSWSSIVSKIKGKIYTVGRRTDVLESKTRCERSWWSQFNKFAKIKETVYDLIYGIISDNILLHI